MRSRLHKGTEPGKGYIRIVSPENSELRYIEFGRLFLPERGDEYKSETRDREVALTIFGGKCTVDVENTSQKSSYKMIGSRADVFSGKPTVVYLPTNTRYTVTAETGMFEAGVAKAPSESSYPPVLIRPEDVAERVVGAWNWSRRVYLSVGDNVKAQRLLVGETINPPGNWSSSPPHKHDVKSVGEVPLEEVYFYRVRPRQGYGLQRVYTSPDDKESFDEVYVVEDNDTVVLPRGYHPVVAAPGYQLYYLWVLAGEERRYGAWSEDPKHKWLKDCEPILEDVFYPQ